MPVSPRTRLASARVILALAAVAASAFAGCGGEDSSEQAASTSPAAPEAAGAEGAGTNGPAAGERDKGKDDKASTPSSDPQVAKGQGQQSPPTQLPKGETVPQATPAEEAQATVADIALTSPALASGSPPTLPTPYTCEGRDSWPALQWQGIPQDSEELILFAANLRPVGGKIFFDWAVAGLDPSLQGLEAGRLPQGAIRGKNSFDTTGYSICPPKGKAETYVFALHAIPEELSPPKGFDPAQLRQRILAQAANAGILVFAYGR